MNGSAAGQTSVAILWLVAIVAFSGCTRHDTAKTAESAAERKHGFAVYGADRVILDSIRVDLDRDGKKEFVVTSCARRSRPDGLGKSFDRIEVFSYDPATDTYSSLFVDPVISGARVTFRKLGKSSTLGILVDIDAGGNDPIASRGLNVYGYRSDGRFTVLFYAESGAPELRDLDGDGIPEILVTGEYGGIAPRAEDLHYTEGVYEFDGYSYVESNVAFAKYFDGEIAARRKAYTRLKAHHRAVDSTYGEAVYRAAADLLLWISAKNDVALLRRTWEAEKPFVASVAARELVDDLEDLVQTAVEDAQARAKTRGGAS